MIGIVMFVVGYLTHKYKDEIIGYLDRTTAKIQAFIDSKR